MDKLSRLSRRSHQHLHFDKETSCVCAVSSLLFLYTYCAAVMKSVRCLVAVALFSLQTPCISSFQLVGSRIRREKVISFAEADEGGEMILECATFDDADRLKRELLQLGASYDRGFGASQRARQEVLGVIEELERCNMQTNASRGIEGNDEEDGMVPPLKGKWRMIWTTAVDVLLLEASPIFSTGAIYQVFEPPIVTNIIDFIPRAQSLFPPDFVPNSLLRAKVKTRASARDSNRVGLVFEKVQLQPLQVLGQSVDVFPPLKFNLPKLPGTDESNGPGYFDVTFLDDEMLIIRQNAPGGLFVLLKVDSIEA